MLIIFWLAIVMSGNLNLSQQTKGTAKRTLSCPKDVAFQVEIYTYFSSSFIKIILVISRTLWSPRL